MPKNLSHLTSVHDAAASLRKSLLAYNWLIDVVVLQPTIARNIVVDKSDSREIVVVVSDDEHIQPPTTYCSWPVRYEKGHKRNM